MTLPLWIKIVLSPGTVANLGACVAIWLVLKYGWRRTRAFARPWLICTATFYTLLSLPVVANAIIGGLPLQSASPSAG